MEFKRWLEALNDEQTKSMSEWGYQLIDEFKIGGMEIFLLKSDVFPEKFKFHLAFQKEGIDVFSIDQQMNRPRTKGISVFDGFKIISPIMNKIVGWLKSYGDLTIASTNPQLTDKWIKNLTLSSRYLDIPINIKSKNYAGHILHLISLT